VVTAVIGIEPIFADQARVKPICWNNTKFYRAFRVREGFGDLAIYDVREAAPAPANQAVGPSKSHFVWTLIFASTAKVSLGAKPKSEIVAENLPPIEVWRI
jgi:hypothetical protein